MLQFSTKKALGEYLDQQRQLGKTIGFVPTMGALHEGHASLVKIARKSTDIVTVSVFVNPTQFNDKNDLQNYPRTEVKDCQLLESLGVDAVFLPSVDEMYPEPDTRVFDFAGIDRVMEGEHRPGHFNGVAQVVSRLFDIVNPDKAFFGEKDYQQIAIIKQMVKTLGYKLEIVPCPIVRGADGLALSSRNALLTPEHRAVAPFIHKTLSQVPAMAATKSPAEICNWVVETINSQPLLEAEYFQIVDDETMMPINTFTKGRKSVGCVAVWAGKVRLIDNVVF